MTSFRAILLRHSLRLISLWSRTASLRQLRTFTDAAALFAPAGSLLTPMLANGVPIEWIRPAGIPYRSLLFYLHGGTFTLGSSHSHRSLVIRLCQASQAHAVVVNYRLAPEHPFPAALVDCWHVYHWLLQSGIPAQDIICIGDSAGGNLVLALLLALRDAGQPLPGAAVCLSPMTDLTCTGASYTTHRQRDPLLTPEIVKRMVTYYLQGHNPHFPFLSPLYGNLEGLPPLLIQVGTEEILLSDALRFAEQARVAGVAVQLQVWQSMWHVWQSFAPLVPEAQQAIVEIGAYIERQRTANIALE